MSRAANMGKPAEIAARLFRRDGFDRQLQASADGFGDSRAGTPSSATAL